MGRGAEEGFQSRGLGVQTREPLAILPKPDIFAPAANGDAVLARFATIQSNTMKALDLTQQPPRSPRVRLGGFVILPRVLDKCRSQLAGTQGEYKYACPLDQQFFQFAGIDPEALKAEVAAGKGDGELLAWIQANSSSKPTPSAIAAWSSHQEQRAPSEPDGRGFFNDVHTKIAPHREDIVSWFDLLDVDDYVSYGGQA